jgi:hypothetical protein
MIEQLANRHFGRGKEAIMSIAPSIRQAALASGLFAMALAAQPASAAAQTTPAYPWCTVGEEVHCYYATRQQPEETVDYHGFCEQNPDIPRTLIEPDGHIGKGAWPSGSGVG